MYPIYPMFLSLLLFFASCGSTFGADYFLYRTPDNKVILSNLPQNKLSRPDAKVEKRFQWDDATPEDILRTAVANAEDRATNERHDLMDIEREWQRIAELNAKKPAVVINNIAAASAGGGGGFLPATAPGIPGRHK